MVLAYKQTHRPKEQNQTLAYIMNQCLTSEPGMLTMEMVVSSINYIGKLDIHIQNNKIESILHCAQKLN